MVKSCFLSHSERFIIGMSFFVDFVEVKYNTRKPLFAYNTALNFETDEKFEAQKNVLNSSQWLAIGC